MEKHIKEWYAGYGQQIGKIVKGRPQGITPEQIEIAAEQIYTDLHTGKLEISAISLARVVKARAKELDASLYMPKTEEIERLKRINKELDEKITKVLFRNRVHIGLELGMVVLLLTLFIVDILI